MTLRRLSRSTALPLLALVAMANACALPRARPRVAPDFASGATRVRSVALLPVDVGLHVADPDLEPGELGQLQADVSRQLATGLSRALTARGYLVSAEVRPDGTGLDPARGEALRVIHPADLTALRVQIHNATQAGRPGARVSVDLARQVGQATGADATLYARTWVHVAPGSDDRSTAVTVLITVLLVVLVVGIVIALVASKSKGGGAKAVGKAMGKVAAGAARTAFVAGQVALRTAPYVIASAARHAGQVPCHSCGPADHGAPPPHEASAGAGGSDEPGAVAVGPDRVPVLVLRDPGLAPPSKSTVGLFFSLLHNRTGRVLWHAGQELQLRVEEGADVEDLAQHFLQHLPPAR